MKSFCDEILQKLKFQIKFFFQYEPYITPGNEAFTHHITVSSCFHPDFKQLDKHILSEGVDCTETANMPKDFAHCFNPYFMWGVGGGAFLLPKDVGFPIGDEESNTYLLLNIHYDNPELIEGRVDSSGLKFFYTKTLRKYEAFTMSVGSALDRRMFIPPNQSQFHISGHCDPKCFGNVCKFLNFDFKFIFFFYRTSIKFCFCLFFPEYRFKWLKRFCDLATRTLNW